MNSKSYKWCVVPLCNNTSTKTPHKVFVYVPNKGNVRKKWLKLARRDPAHLSTESSIYFCEDHFDLPNDMENYMEYHIMGRVSQVRMKPGCLPSKFECQPDRKRTSNSVERQYILKKERMVAIEECKNECNTVTELCNQSELQYRSSGTDENPQGEEAMEDKAIQVNMKHKFRSKATQTQINFIHQATSPSKTLLTSVSTSPFKVQTLTKENPYGSSLTVTSRDIFSMGEDMYDSGISRRPASPSQSSSSICSLQMKSSASSDCSEIVEEKQRRDSSQNLQSTLKKIKKRPRFYIGVPENCYFIIDMIQKDCNIPEHHLLLCLKKIRLDTRFSELADEFAMCETYASKIFLKYVPIIASLMRSFLLSLDNQLIKRNLPISFRHKYHNISCIIDCLEIEVQKPSKAVYQSLTWSEYKKANTVKYLISCTPNGLVHYISPGLGGRVSDTCLVESCDFVKSLRSGMFVLADRGFKHIEQFLLKEGIQLVRPPSVGCGAKLTKSEVLQTKQIASLRIHVERLIRRLREFSMLKPHACVNTKSVAVLDDVITIACGLINLQDSLIK